MFSWQNSVSLCPASFCTPRPNLPVTPGISWLLTFAFQSPRMKRTSFLVLVLEGPVGLHRTIQLQLLQHYWLGIDCDIEWFALETNRDHSVIFEISPKYCILASFVDYDGYSISSKGFQPTVVDIMAIWVKITDRSSFYFTDSKNVYDCHLLFGHFQFTLIHGPNIQVPMQYCSLQHWYILLTRKFQAWIKRNLAPSHAD